MNQWDIISYHIVPYHIISYCIIFYQWDRIVKDFLEFTQTCNHQMFQRNTRESRFSEIKQTAAQFSWNWVFTEKTSSFSIVIHLAWVVLFTASWTDPHDFCLRRGARLKNWKTQHFVCLCIHIANWASWKTKNSARPTSLEWHRYHNWSYSLTRFRDIWGPARTQPSAKYLNISKYLQQLTLLSQISFVDPRIKLLLLLTII